jgi:molecular chaperone DnaJ
VSARAGWEEIRQNFRVLVRRYHPDLNPDNEEAAAQFRQVRMAYEAILAARSRSRRHQQQYARSQFTVSDELFEEAFGISRPDPHRHIGTGADFRYDLRISLVAALFGMETSIEVPRFRTCRHCQGSGRAAPEDAPACPECQGRGHRTLGPGLLRLGPVCGRCQGRGKLQEKVCPQCHGQGRQVSIHRYEVKIPPGAAEGTRLCIAGEGGQGFHNGPPGNLEVVISVEPHDFFTRRGQDLYCQVQVSFAQAALGGLIRIPTLTGYRMLNIPKGLQSGRIFRLPGGGAPGGPARQSGDQIIEVMVTTPNRLTSGQRDILEELARLEQGEFTLAAHE